MASISDKNKQKINEQILAYLFDASPELRYTVEIARELARDEEFIKFLLEELEKKKLVISVTKSPEGIQYTRRVRWRLSNVAYNAYKRMSQ